MVHVDIKIDFATNALSFPHVSGGNPEQMVKTGTHMKNKRTRYACAPPDWPKHRRGHKWRLQKVVAVAIIILLTHIGLAQNLIINGTVNNTGKIRVKNQTIIAQSAVGGELELTGANQVLTAKQYQSIRLSGTGTKTTSGGDFSIQKNLTIAAAVTLQIPQGNIITLGDTLFESGTLKGAIQKSVNLTGSTTSSNFGNIGATISWSSTAPGITNVIRASDSVQTGNGNASIKRYYQIQPTDATATGTVTFKFADNELNGHDINNLQLWRSGDNGATWQRQIPVVDTLLKTISKTNVTLAGRWAMADTVRALGPLNSTAGIPSSMANASVTNIQPRILTTLNAFKVLITDIFGTPLKNVPVSFAISTKPLTASGEQLSDTLVVTDSLGYASTMLTLGNKVGTYEVTATSSSLTPIVIPTIAKYGLPTSIAKATNLVQSKPILSPLDSLFTITVSDIGGNRVDSAQVQFALVELPIGSFGQLLSVTNVLSDSLGRASTKLTLGSKAATYKVKATVNGIADSAIFNATAVPGSPSSIAQFGGNNQSGVNGQALAVPFVATITDIGGNPVQGDTVQFTIQSTPFGATLNPAKAVTDILGQASTILTLGTKTGSYVVQAQSSSIVSTVTFNAKALVGAPVLTNIVSGNNQSFAINKVLVDSFVVHVNDANGNPVPNAPVTFAIDTIPSGAVGALLSVVNTTTDTLGNASTRLTLGNKVGLYVVNARVNSVPIVSFTTTAVAGIAGVPSSMANASTTNIQPRILTTLNAFKVLITDIFGTPVKNVPVTFAISAKPLTAVGEQLSDTLVNTDSLGFATTVLTLGNKVGTYAVTATSPLLTPVVVSTIAKYGLPVSLAKVNSTIQTKPILSPLDSLFTITVSDIGGNPVDSAIVQFAIINIPNGSVQHSLSVTNGQTDSLGRASTRLTLGSKAATYNVKATVSGIADSAIFNATAIPGSPSSIANNGGTNQSGVNGQPLADPFVAFVTDAGGNPVQGDTVKFAIQNSQTFGATLSATKVVTNNLGIASTILTLGTKTNVPYIVQAQSVSIGGALTYNAFALPGAVAAANIVSGNNQTLPISRVLSDSFVVRVNDANGNPVPNTPVKFTIASGPIGGVGILSIVDATSDDSGKASTKLTLGNKVGVYVVNASVNGVPIVSFNATATAGAAASYTALSGNNQSAQIITALGNALVVHVVDAGGNNVAGAIVNFAMDTIPANATGQIIPNAVISDANGIASATFTVGNKVGLYRVRASGVGVSDVLFSASATHGAANAMAASAGFNQTKPILSDLDVPFTVRVTDIGGNDVPTSNVTFTITKKPVGDTSASIPNIALTDSFGSASARLKLGSKVGMYEVTALITTLGDVESRSIGNKKLKTESVASQNIAIPFTAIATHGAAALLAQISGNGQIRPTATTLDTAFIVSVKDIGGNVIPKAQVSFAITSRPTNSVGQRLADTLVTADSLGVASTLLTLGDLEGSYVVSATSSGISSAQFASNAYYIFGDPNNDIDVNVADITMLVDHIYSKNVFSLGDSIKSDLNKDGKIDTSDVGVIRDNILSNPLIFTNMIEPLGTLNKSGAQTDGTPSNAEKYFSDASTQLEVTPQGLRLNLVNTVPVRGIELRLRTHDTTAVEKINYLFSRAENMDVIVRSFNNEITILVYSLLNSEIQPGEGTILRLPKITSLAQIDTSQVVLALISNKAVKSLVKIASAPPNSYPTTYRLEQNFPNPFNGSTIIRYDIPDVRATETKTAIQVFNILGQKVKTLINAPHDPGPHQVVWDGTNDNGERVATGVYFYRLITKNFLTTKKMIYVK